MTQQITVWHDETSDRHGWIVDLCDGDTSETIVACESEHEAQRIAEMLRAWGVTTQAGAARMLGSIRTPRKTRSSRANAAKASQSPKVGRPRTTLWWAIAQFSGKDAGVVCCDLTKDGCRAKAQAKTTMDFVVRRDAATPEQIAALGAVGKL